MYAGPGRDYRYVRYRDFDERTKYLPDRPKYLEGNYR
jgi:hypothetical protein